MNSLNHSHSDRLFNPHHAGSVTILGAGSVGSQAALMLAHVGVKDITLYDSDDVRSHNLPMTLAFGIQDLGRFKTDVVRERALKDTGVEIRIHQEMYTDQPLKGEVLCCVDTMEARQSIWKKVRGNPNVGLLVDTRTHKNFISVYRVHPCVPDDMAFYESRLYPTRATPVPTCGSHGIVYVAVTAAALAVRALTDFWDGDMLKSVEERILFGASHVSSYNTLQE